MRMRCHADGPVICTPIAPPWVQLLRGPGPGAAMRSFAMVRPSDETITVGNTAAANIYTYTTLSMTCDRTSMADVTALCRSHDADNQRQSVTKKQAAGRPVAVAGPNRTSLRYRLTSPNRSI